MRILIIGSGGREHALAWKLNNEGHEVYCAPGNAGIAQVARIVRRDPRDFAGVIDYVRRTRIDLTVVGPEQPLAEGIADRFAEAGLAIFGPSRTAAQLESNKAFAKNLMQEAGVPTARFAVFSDVRAACAYADTQGYPLVIKASGLALGKGVITARTRDEAYETIEQLLVKRIFGKAGETIVIEEFLRGEEASIIGITDGQRVLFLPPAQDHKPLLDGDQGPNTGGMGAYAPAPVITPQLQEEIEEKVFQPLLAHLVQKGIVYRGVLYAGIMVTDQGPYVLEFNCRFGDPETQVLMPLLRANLGELMLSAARGELPSAQPELNGCYALCVVAASAGYPGDYERGKLISGELVGDRDLIVFHAGTSRQRDGIVTAGGRVLGVTGLGRTLIEARERAYWGLRRVWFQGMYYRRDIGEKGIHRLLKAQPPLPRAG